MEKIIIWDFNGTLVNDAYLGAQINNELNQEHGLPRLEEEYYRDHFTHPPRIFYEEIGYDFSRESYDELSREFMRRYVARQGKVQLTRGVRENLDEFARRGVRQFIVSAHSQELLLEHTAALGIDHYFEQIIGTDSTVVTGKVQRAQQFAAQSGIDFTQAIFIGDTDHDQETAQALGCRCLLYSGGHQSRRRLERCGLPVLDDMLEVRRVVESIWRQDQQVFPERETVRQGGWPLRLALA